MKRLLYILLALTLCACEVINEADRLIPVPLPIANGRKHVLLEFTGFRCVNCPEAAEKAASLQALYGENLIVIALHPASNPFTQGAAEYDYTCPEADSIYRFMGGTETTPFPTGNIDMQPNRDDRYPLGPEYEVRYLLLARRRQCPRGATDAGRIDEHELLPPACLAGDLQ